jgi:hypothetical protein
MIFLYSLWHHKYSFGNMYWLFNAKFEREMIHQFTFDEPLNLVALNNYIASHNCVDTGQSCLSQLERPLLGLLVCL